MLNIHRHISTDKKVMISSKYLSVLLTEELSTTGMPINLPIMSKISQKLGPSAQDSTIPSHNEDPWISIAVFSPMVLSKCGFIVEILMMLYLSPIPKRTSIDSTDPKLEIGAPGM